MRFKNRQLDSRHFLFYFSILNAFFSSKLLCWTTASGKLQSSDSYNNNRPCEYKQKESPSLKDRGVKKENESKIVNSSERSTPPLILHTEPLWTC